ncbi:MAG TPA: magnesium transporter [Planctomycetes bacterium]|nr:magnesium transporter [Planctomycetota bacterium]
MRFHLLTPEIRELLAEGRYSDLVEVLQDMHPGDAASILGGLEVEEIASILAHLPQDFERDVFGYLEPEVQEHYVDGAGRDRVQQVVQSMLSDDRAEFLDRLAENVRKRLMPMLSTAAREDLLRRDTFREDQVGSILITEYAVLGGKATARSAIASLRRQAPSKETIYYSYVLDRSGKLLGFVSLRDLILAADNETVEELMKTDLVSITADGDQEEAARLIRDYDLIALPVVDSDGNLVGIVTHDDAVDIVEEEAQEDFEKMAGITGHGAEIGDYDYVDEPVLRQIRRRAPVLCLLAVFWVITSALIHYYANTITDSLLIAMLPMVMATGGMVGTQASALVIRALTIGDVAKATIKRVLWKELRVAGVMALLLGIIALLDTIMVSILNDETPSNGMTTVAAVSAAIGIAMIGHVLIAALLGALTPIIVKKLRGDPAMISTPAVTAIADLTGVLIYIVTVTLMLPTSQ